MPRYELRPVTSDSWAHFAHLFEARGAPHYCWCAAYRFADAHTLTASQKKVRMRRAVASGVPIGVLAYDGDTPVGWCSVAPRQAYLKLERSRVMPRVTPAETETWTVLCFFVLREHRGNGLMLRLLRGAVAYAKRQGAKVIEGYPFDTAGISSQHRGHSSVFEAARFEQSGRRWALSLRGGEKRGKAANPKPSRRPRGAPNP